MRKKRYNGRLTYYTYEGDNHVDQNDFGLFQRCYSGPDWPVDPNCVN
ncbi:MAG: hypothetical protein ACYTF1_05780 [Planctomycetota bacterium]